MSEAKPQVEPCVNCKRDETEVPVTEWRWAGRSFWVCPDCLPQLIHHRAQVMPRWGLTGSQASGQQGG